MSVTSPALADGFFTSSTTLKPEGLGRQRCSQSPPPGQPSSLADACSKGTGRQKLSGSFADQSLQDHVNYFNQVILGVLPAELNQRDLNRGSRTNLKSEANGGGPLKDANDSRASGDSSCVLEKARLSPHPPRKATVHCWPASALSTSARSVTSTRLPPAPPNVTCRIKPPAPRLQRGRTAVDSLEPSQRRMTVTYN